MNDQKPDKVFCIGMNRTGSTSLYEYLIKVGYKTTHDPNWWYWRFKSGLDQYDGYTDGFEGYKLWNVYPNLRFLKRCFPNAKYIANTRPLNAWLTSRLKHNSPNYRKRKIKKDDFSLLKSWTKNRNHWHGKIMHFSEKSPDNVLWLNIHEEGATTLLENFLNLPAPIDFPHLNSINNNNQAVITVNAFLERYIEEADHESTRVAEWKK